MEVNFTPGDLVRARGREWVVLPYPGDEVLKLRPLYGSESDTVIIHRLLEKDPVESTGFDMPDNAVETVQSKAALLADALRLTLRRGAGPFRSAAQLTFEPRAYQLVPLLMALRLQVPRMLIADDVGIGKTIEAGLILRELMDRGEVDAFSVLCPPHLVEQWEIELKSRFGIEAVVVTSGSAARLERNLPLDQTLFSAYPNTIVSLDYIKAEKRREGFASSCPDFVIVDEAHACVGTHKGKQQRFNLLKRLAEEKTRRLVMLTATPHSGDEDAFARLLALIDPSFEEMNFDDEKYRVNLARHFVQRRRVDLEDGWKEDRSFPVHKTKEHSYRLSEEHLDFQKSVLDYCFDVVEKVGKEDKRERRLAFWSTLALMRCVGSSPAAAYRALRNRASGEGERLESQIYDDDGDDEDAVDMEPGSSFPDSELGSLIRRAENLIGKPDPKLSTLIDELKPLIKNGVNAVVFCRYIATAKHVRDGLGQAFPKIRVESVTGELTPDQRRECVVGMASTKEGDGEEVQRILVATDCLSEGVNLQRFFNAVIHYDLSWNPVRHQQREGRVNRFGQPDKEVHSIMMFSSDSAIDGAVLDVILRKAKDIHKATGVTVPLPDKRGPVTDALMASMMLRQGGSRKQMAFDLRLSDGTKLVEACWRDASENEKKSRTRFAQNAMKPQEVAPEWAKAQLLLGSPTDVKFFVEQAMACFGIELELQQSVLLAHVSELDNSLKERLAEKDIKNSVRLAVKEPVPAGATLLTRTHPLTATLAEALVEASLDSESLPSLGIGRVGAWPTRCVKKTTRIALLRIRYKLTVHARKERLLLAEETALVAIEGSKIITTGEEVRKLLNTQAEADLKPPARRRFVEEAKKDLPNFLKGTLAEFVKTRASELEKDHSRLRDASGPTSRVTVKGVVPPDVIGLFVLIPSAE